MRVWVDIAECIGCGACEAYAPTVFKMGGNEYPTVAVDEVPAELETDVNEAVRACPVAVINIEE